MAQCLTPSQELLASDLGASCGLPDLCTQLAGHYTQGLQQSRLVPLPLAKGAPPHLPQPCAIGYLLMPGCPAIYSVNRTGNDTHLCSASPNLKPMPGCFMQPYPSLGLDRSGSLPPAAVGHCRPFSGPCPFSVHPCPHKCHILTSAVTSLMCPPTSSAPHSPYRAYCSIPDNYRKHPEALCSPEPGIPRELCVPLAAWTEGLCCLAMLQVSQTDR